jgi:hypothetical protein
MSDNKTTLSTFLSAVKPSQKLWGLQDKVTQGWVILDSILYEDTDVMPLWSSAELAQQHCIDEWASYEPCAISVSDWLEFWLADLNSDGIIIGVNWLLQGDCTEMELADFTQALAEIELLK